jgi:hypothetical protein
MLFAGIVIVLFLSTVGLALTQFVFYHHTGRIIWRAMMPTRFRFLIYPKDKIKMDAFNILEEWAAICLFGSFMLLPLIALNATGFINIF